MDSNFQITKLYVFTFVRQEGIMLTLFSLLKTLTLKMLRKQCFLMQFYYHKLTSISVSGKSYGADRDTKLTLYRALIRSKIQYACKVYGSARQPYLQVLEPIQT